jgi:hypothetical protein
MVLGFKEGDELVGTVSLVRALANALGDQVQG